MSPDETNPYSPPSSEPLPPPAWEGGQFPLASPSIRLGSAIIDGLINLAIFTGIRYSFSALGVTSSWFHADRAASGLAYGTAIIGVLVFYAVQWKFLSQSGQTIGKKLTRIRIATMTGEKPSMTDLMIKRYGFMNLMSFIPVVGGFVGLADVLCIFRKDRRCLHDQIAGTQVIRIVERGSWPTEHQV